MENEEQKPIEEVVEQAVEQVKEDVKPVDDRPEINYKAELERRRANEERLQRELEAERSKQVKRYDANDITTWSDTELYALKNSQDPNHLAYKQKAEDELMERKIERGIEKRQSLEKRGRAEATLRTQYPEALNPYSEFAQAMESVINELNLEKSPASRLAAAEIVAARSSKGSGKTSAAERKAEEARLKDVKQTLSEGDRPDPRKNLPNPTKNEDLLKTVNNPKSSHEDIGAAMGDLLKKKGFDINKMFPR